MLPSWAELAFLLISPAACLAATTIMNLKSYAPSRRMSYKERKKRKEQAGAELWQAQFKIGLVKPAVARFLPSLEPAILSLYPASYS